MGKQMQQLAGLCRRAIAQYGMLAPDDRVCVAVSGGKDSLTLAVALQQLHQYLGIPFSVVAVTLDMGFRPDEAIFADMQAFLEKAGIETHVLQTDIGHVVFDVREEQNPCALCARMRRGVLHQQAKALGCTKIALGHHLDDAVETFYMNLFGGGELATFSPVSYLSRRDLTMIRPMCLATEQEVEAAFGELGIAAVKSGCPVDGNSQRERMKQWVAAQSKEDPAFKQKTLAAWQKVHLSGW